MDKIQRTIVSLSANKISAAQPRLIQYKRKHHKSRERGRDTKSPNLAKRGKV